jgi:hypothetical protein
MIDKYALGRLLADDLPAVAVQALENGYDSPSLRQLAGADASNPQQIRSLFLKALDELNLPLPSAREAGLSLARSIANEVLEGTVMPYEGAKRIWHEVYVYFPELKELKLFVGLASEYEDDRKHRDSYSERIVEECKMLLEK